MGGGFHFTLQLLLCELLFAIYLPKRSKFWLRYLLCSAVCLVIGYFSPTGLDVWLFQLLILGFFALTVITQVVCLKTNLWTYSFVSIAGYTVQHLAQQPKNLIMNALTFDDRATRSLVENIIIYISLAIVCGLVYLLFVRKLKNNLPNLDKRR